MDRTFTVGWKVSALLPNIASVRYRALFPLLALKERGSQCRLFSDGDFNNLDGLDVLVIVKSFTAEDIFLAQEAWARGLPVVFDLCDNIFIGDYVSMSGDPVIGNFLIIANFLTAIVTTTTPLADEICQHIQSHVPVYIVPDGIETKPLIDIGLRLLNMARICLLLKLVQQPSKLIRKLVGRCLLWIKVTYERYCEIQRRVHHLAESTQTVAPNKSTQLKPKILLAQGSVRRILWFGNHGALHARFGMLDLLEIREALEGIAAEFKVELVVVSNNLEKYRKHILPMAIPSSYVEWSMNTIAEHLHRADVVVMPNTRDPFSICKSANRAVLALLHGAPVVATSTPALMPLRTCIEFDDFQAGLRRYLTDPKHACTHVERGRKLIAELYGQPAIGTAWLDILKAVTNVPRHLEEESTELVVVLDLIQDLDLAIPLLQVARARKLSVEVWCSVALLIKSPRVRSTLDSLGVHWRVLPERLGKLQIMNLFRGIKGLLSVSETNLSPHRFSHHLTKVAQEIGIVTGTLQHGFENVGLTYSDKIHKINKIFFAADRIYVWGPLHTLHPDIPEKTRVKCFPVGCPKPASPMPANLSFLLPEAGGMIVGVFENLHWHRYSDEYRKFFIDGVQRLVAAFPEVTFLVKPHHAGLWLTNMHTGLKPSAPNLIIADPQSPDWEPFTASQLLGHLHAVITTPSTVAVDAARIGLPTAVVAHGLRLDNYAPLFSIYTEDAWLDFVRAIKDATSRSRLIESSRKFISHVLVTDDAAKCIVDDMINRIHTQVMISA